MKACLQLSLTVPFGDETNAARAALAACWRPEHEKSLLALAMALIQVAEERSGRLVVVADLPKPAAVRLLPNMCFPMN